MAFPGKKSIYQAQPIVTSSGESERRWAVKVIIGPLPVALRVTPASTRALGC